eukprot:322764-Amphidinium_carterae.1
MKGKGSSKGRGKDGRGRGKGGGRPSAPGAEVDGVYFEMMLVDEDDLQVASDSDVPDDVDPKKTWVQTLEDEHGVADQVRGRKRCRICRGRE